MAFCGENGKDDGYVTGWTQSGIVSYNQTSWEAQLLGLSW